MTTEDEFTHRLIGFGLSEKEAQTYLHLLKYGPKTPSPLAKSLHTYREDVHRALTSLIDKGMVRPSLDSPTTYAAVDLEARLNQHSISGRANSARWRCESENCRNLQSSSHFDHPPKLERLKF